METLSSTTTTSAIGIPSSSPISIFSSSSSSSLKKKNFSATTPPPPRFLNFPIASKNDENEADLQSDSNKMNIVPFMNNRFSPLSKDAAMGLVLSAAVGRGWTTGSGMEGPPTPVGFDTDDDSNDTTKGRISTFPWSLFTKSPRRRMRVAFTCNICSQRTTRAINPHAYTDGTVFVQCCGCYAYHKLVDNLNLFEEMNCYVNPNFNYENPNGDVRFKYLDMDSDDDDDDDIFPGL